MTHVYLRVAYVNYWTDPVNDKYFTQFLQHHFGDKFEILEVPHTSSPDILISSVFGNLSYIRKINAKIKIFFTGENLNRKEYSSFSNKKTLANYFDIVLGFDDTDVEYKIYKFPLWLIYFKFYDMKRDDNVISFIEREHVKNRHGLRRKFCTLVARHDRSGIRSKIVRAVNKIGNVSFGGPFRLNGKACDQIIPSGSNHKIEYIKESVYNICPENSSNRGYCTEKLFEALQAGCIPIYWGSSIPKELNEEKIIMYNATDEDSFLKNFEIGNDRDFDGPVFTSEGRSMVSRYYDDLKKRLDHFINTRISDIP